MGIEEKMVPMIVVYKGSLIGNRWMVDKPSIVIGRALDCDVVIPDRQISRYHVRIESDQHGYLLRDLGSKNGSFVNGESISEQPYRLNDGDEIILAHVCSLGFVTGEVTLPLDSSREKLGTLSIDDSTKSVVLGRKELDPPLSPAQFTLLSLLINAEGRVISREEVIHYVWPDAEGGVTDQAVDALVYRLRERLMEIDAVHNYIVTVRGHGFRFA